MRLKLVNMGLFSQATGLVPVVVDQHRVLSDSSGRLVYKRLSA